MIAIHIDLYVDIRRSFCIFCSSHLFYFLKLNSTKTPYKIKCFQLQILIVKLQKKQLNVKIEGLNKD